MNDAIRMSSVCRKWRADVAAFLWPKKSTRYHSTRIRELDYNHFEWLITRTRCLRRLEIDNYRIDDRFMNLISRCDSLEKIKFKFVTGVSSTGFSKLVLLNNIKDLNFSHCDIDDCDLASLLFCYKKLERLELHWPYNDDSINDGSCLKFLPESVNSLYINLYSVKNQERALKSLEESDAVNLKNLKITLFNHEKYDLGFLKRFDLDHFDYMFSSFGGNLKSIQKFKPLKILSLRQAASPRFNDCIIDDQNMKPILQNQRQLTKIHLGTYGAQGLAVTSKTICVMVNYCQSITHLDIRGSNIFSGDELMCLLRFKNLKRLDLKYVYGLRCNDFITFLTRIGQNMQIRIDNCFLVVDNEFFENIYSIALAKPSINYILCFDFCLNKPFVFPQNLNILKYV